MGAMEVGTQAEQKSLLADARAWQAHPAAAPSVRVRAGPRHAPVPAHRPGDRARPARLLPQPGLEGSRVPVPPRGRGGLLGDRLRDRPRHQVLPGLRRPGAADPEAERQDRDPPRRRGAVALQLDGRGRRPARRRRGRLHALRRLAAPGGRPGAARRGAPRLRPLRDAADRLGLPARLGDRQKGRARLLLRDRLRRPDGDGDGRRRGEAEHAEARPREGQGLPRPLQRGQLHPGGRDPPLRGVGGTLAGGALGRLEGRRRQAPGADPVRARGGRLGRHLRPQRVAARVEPRRSRSSSRSRRSCSPASRRIP